MDETGLGSCLMADFGTNCAEIRILLPGSWSVMMNLYYSRYRNGFYRCTLSYDKWRRIMFLQRHFHQLSQNRLNV